MSSSLTAQVISPTQAANIYTQAGQFPKQRNVFLVRFQLNGTGASGASTMTYAVKAFDRPIIQPIVEEVNQYNKKRHVYTGYKKSPIKCVFYDDAVGSAQKFWAGYSQYYFGDFAVANQTNAAFSDDIISSQFLDPGSTGFGFIPQTNRWYIQNISILHFHNTIYDLYTILNPRIMAFNPDELDYEQSAVAQITVEFAYEAIIFQPNYGGNNNTASSQPEFASGQFNGRTSGTEVSGTTEQGTTPSTSANPVSSITSSIQQLVNGSGYAVSQAGSSLSSALNSSYFNTPSTGGLGLFGNFIFGAAKTAGGQYSAGASTLASLAQSNPALAQTLGIGNVSGNPLATTAPLGVYSTTAGYTGAPPQYPGTVAGISAAMSSNYGSINQTIAQGVLAASQITGQGGYNNTSGLLLAAQALGIINATQPGTAQYGYNSQTGAGLTIPSVLGATPSGQATGATSSQAPASTQTAYTSTSTPVTLPSSTVAPAVANPNSAPDNSNPYSSVVDPDSGVTIG